MVHGLALGPGVSTWGAGCNHAPPPEELPHGLCKRRCQVQVRLYFNKQMGQYYKE